MPCCHLLKASCLVTESAPWGALVAGTLLPQEPLLPLTKHLYLPTTTVLCYVMLKACLEA